MSLFISHLPYFSWAADSIHNAKFYSMTTRSEITYRLASRLPQLNESDAKLVVDSILTAMTTALSNGERIEIRGFGSFSLVHRQPRKGRNPKTGEAVAVGE